MVAPVKWFALMFRKNYLHDVTTLKLHIHLIPISTNGEGDEVDVSFNEFITFLWALSL